MITQYKDDVKTQYTNKEVRIVDEDGVIQKGFIQEKKYYGDIVFAKFYRRGKDILSKSVGCSRFDVLLFLAFSCDVGDNITYYTQDDISKGSGVPIRTVERILVRFQETGLVIRNGNKEWALNPYTVNRVEIDREPFLFKRWYQIKEKIENRKSKEE